MHIQKTDVLPIKISVFFYFIKTILLFFSTADLIKSKMLTQKESWSQI